MPLEEVYDPTGAGDSFAGGFMGYLSEAGQISHDAYRKAVVYGTVMASFCVEDFSFKRLETLSRTDIEERVKSFSQLTNFS